MVLIPVAEWAGKTTFSWFGHGLMNNSVYVSSVIGTRARLGCPQPQSGQIFRPRLGPWAHPQSIQARTVKRESYRSTFEFTGITDSHRTVWAVANVTVSFRCQSHTIRKTIKWSVCGPSRTHFAFPPYSPFGRRYCAATSQSRLIRSPLLVIERCLLKSLERPPCDGGSSAFPSGLQRRPHD